jgi:autophagy-related protein 17
MLASTHSSQRPSRPNSIDERRPSPGELAPGVDDIIGDENAHGIEEANSSAVGDVPVEVLVEHLLAAKRSLSSMALVLRANDLTTQARQLHEEAAVLASQTKFLRRGIGEQVRVLARLRKGMGRAYDGGRREFRQLLRALDASDARLEGTMRVLRETTVESVFRPDGEEPKTLMDFVDEKSVDGMRNALKESIAELQVRKASFIFILVHNLLTLLKFQAAQTSFDGDLLRFDNDLRSLNKALILSSLQHEQAIQSASPTASATTGSPQLTMSHLLVSLAEHSHVMAEHLTSLTRHFDMCVTAVRTTEGGAALALRKASSMSTEDEDVVSISGVVGGAAGGSSRVDDGPLLSAQERAEVVAVVVQDAPEVDEVVAELGEALTRMEADFELLKNESRRTRTAHDVALGAFRALDEVGAHRLAGYVAAEVEFIQRWLAEREVIAARLDEMDQLSLFYEGYVGAYDGLILEVERRRAVEDKIRAVWRKARESVDRLLDADRRERDVFRHEIGDFLPTDLWVGMDGPLRRWEVVSVEDGDVAAEGSGATALDRSVVDAAKGRRMGRS